MDLKSWEEVFPVVVEQAHFLGGAFKNNPPANSRR